MRDFADRRLHQPGAVLGGCLVALFMTTLPGLASVPAVTDWGLLETEHFTLFSNLDEAAIRAVGVHMEQLRAVLVQQFPEASIDAPVPTLLYVFRDRESFAPFALPGGGAGFLSPHIHANFAALAASDAAEATRVVYRQYANQLIHSEVPQSPLWLRFGLAELLSTFTLEDGVARVGTTPEGDATLSGPQPMSLSEVLSLGQVPASAERAGAFAARSWALVHYLLVEDPERRRKARAWVRRLAEDESLRGAFLEAYSTDAATLEQELEAYLGRDPLPERRLTIERAVATEARYLKLAPADALLSLADLLLHTQPERQAETRELLGAIFEIAPENAPATAGMGFLEQQAGNLSAARDLYARALERLPEQQLARYRDGFRLYFYYGEAELQLLGQRRPQSADERAQLARAVEAFERCGELRPEYGEAWARLGFARNLETPPSPEAVSALEKAYELLPEREDVAINLLLAYARVGEREAASRLVTNLTHRGETEETLARAREILFQIEFNVAAGLIRQGKLDEAGELLERIRDESTNPSLKQKAGELLVKIGR